MTNSVAKFSLSKQATTDLRNIAHYSVKTFGIKRAKIYGDEFQKCFAALSQNVNLGQGFDHIRPGLRCFHHASHSVFYVLTPKGVLIVRVLHNSQDSLRNL